MAKAKEPSDAELLELGKKLQQFYDSGYVNKKRALLYTFYKGIASGFGVFLGGTIVIALLLWILSFFNQVPLANHLVNALSQATKSK